MRNVDFTPLYRHAIGFDRLFNLVEASNTKTQAAGYPPYNIEQTDENNYRITMAVAGFSEERLDLTQNEYACCDWYSCTRRRQELYLPGYC